MYRGENNYPDNSNQNINNLPPLSPYPYPFRAHKIQMPVSSNPSLSYYDQNSQLIPSNQYQYIPPNMIQPPENYDPRYSNWRAETPQSRGPSIHAHSYYERPPLLNQGYMPMPKPMMNYENYQPQPQMNIIQKISFLIKPQLSQLQKIMSKITQKKHESRSRRSPPPRQRQRQRQRDRSRQKDRSKKSAQWVCTRCSFLNFDWRDRCKKCDQVKSNRNNSSVGDDWKCRKCDNINFARRNQCYRCKTVRNR